MNFSEFTKNSQTSIFIAFLLLLFNAPSLFATCKYSQHLSARELNIGNELTWATAQEENSAHFVVERSTDGLSFEELTNIGGAGHSVQERVYRFLDIQTGIPKCFYRLKLMDTDSSSTYSQTVLIDRETENNFLIVAMSSTIMDRSFILILLSESQDSLHYRISDTYGIAHQEGSMETVIGVNTLSFDLLDLENGRYTVDLQLKEEKEELFILKVDPDEMPNVNLATK